MEYFHIVIMMMILLFITQKIFDLRLKGHIVPIMVIFLSFFGSSQKIYAEADICISDTIQEFTFPNIPTSITDMMNMPSKMQDILCNGLQKNFLVYRKGITIKGINEVHDINITVADKDIKMMFDEIDSRVSGLELNGTSNNDHYNPYPNIYNGSGDPGNKGKDKSYDLDNPDVTIHKKFNLNLFNPMSTMQDIFNAWEDNRSIQPYCTEDYMIEDYYYRAGKVDNVHFGDFVPQFIKDIRPDPNLPDGVPDPLDFSMISDGYLYDMPSILPDGTYNLNRWFSGPSAIMNGFKDVLNSMIHFWRSQVVYGSYTKDGKRYENVVINPCGSVIPEVSINDAKASPGATMRFKVDISGEISGDIASAYHNKSYIHYHTEDGNATAGIDYEATSGILEINKGDTEAYIDVNITETAHVGTQFYVILDNALGAEIIDDNATGKIIFGGNHYLTGPFEAWDSFRGDTTGNGKLDDFNISTKISAKDFNITIGSLDANHTSVETKPDIDVRYSLWYFKPDGSEARDTDIEINTFDANVSAAIRHNFTVNKAYRNMYVHIEYCAKQNKAAWADAMLKLYPYSDCSGVAIQEGDISSSNVNKKLLRYHKSDIFAVRPKYFNIVEPNNVDIELLKSGNDYNFTVRAINEANVSTLNYDQNSSFLSISKVLLNKAGESNDTTLQGTISFASNDFYFEDGNSTDSDGNHEVVGLSFDDVGRVSIKFIDDDWASVDADDTPQSCEGGTFNGLEVPYGTFICGDLDATFIPDHFELKDINITNRRKNENFTYISSDLNMSAHVELRIEAVNANGDITKNFRDGNTIYYENPLEVNITVPVEVTFPDGSEKNMTVVDKNISKALLGFGGNDANGTHTIAWDDNNKTQRLLFNYQREVNNPINPFDINGTDVDVNVISVYTSSSGKVAIIRGNGVADKNVTFVYARVKATKDFYDDVKTDSVQTPIKVEVYCDKWPATPETCPGVDALLGSTNDPKWYISTSHDMASNDGNISLVIDEYGSLNTSTPDINKADEGIDEDITVSNASSSLPSITHISTETGDGKTNEWLVYDPDDVLSTGSNIVPLYKVRFIDANSATWSGVGETGKVVGTDASKKKSQRLDW